MSLETIKCPYCGYVFRTDVKKVLEDGKTTVVREIKQIGVSKQGREEYIDLTCPNCDEEFEWQIT
jgi:sarcosine oxidase delta subunit